MKKKLTAKYSVSYRLAFVGKYVSAITSLDRKNGKERCQIEYYPSHDTPRLVERSGKTGIEAFLNCVDSAIRATDKLWPGDGGDREVWSATNNIK